MRTGTGLFLRPADAGSSIRKQIPDDARRYGERAGSWPGGLAAALFRRPRWRSRRRLINAQLNTTAQIESRHQRYFPIFPLAFLQINAVARSGAARAVGPRANR